MSTPDYPPFAPALPIEQVWSERLLPRADIKRTGHLFKDCVGYIEFEAPKGAKAKACPDCVARSAEVGRLAKAHQQAFDAAWYAAAVRSETAGQAAPVSLSKGEEPTAQEAPMRNLVPSEIRNADLDIPKVDIYEAVIDVPAPKPADFRPNKFGGRCVHCDGYVEAGAGALGKNGVGKWVVAHIGQCPQAKPVAAPAAQAEPLTRGPYQLADGQVVLVQISAKGNPYALSLPDKEYLGGGAKLAGAKRLSYEEAAAFGHETGICCCCGAFLENPESVKLGIGPICRAKYF